MTEGRPGMTLALALTVAGSLVMLLAVTRDWYVVAASGLGTVESRMSGSDVRSGLAPLPWVALVGPLAVVALRGTARVLVGGLLVVTALLAVVVTLSWVTQPGAGADDRPLLGPALCLVGAAAVALGGLLCVTRGRTWPGMGASYDPPAGRRAEAVTDKAVWDALDRGDDPTA